jgi:hypothetical protein
VFTGAATRAVAVAVAPECAHSIIAMICFATEAISRAVAIVAALAADGGSAGGCKKGSEEEEHPAHRSDCLMGAGPLLGSL